MTVTIQQAEEAIAAWGYPYAELAELYRNFRDERLKHVEDETERQAIATEYSDRLFRMISRGHRAE